MLFSRLLVAGAAFGGGVGAAAATATTEISPERKLDRRVYDNAQYDNESGDMMFDMLESFSSDIEACGLDLSSLFGNDEYNAQQEPDPMQILEQLKLSKPCTKQEENSMRDELLAFETCSGYELMELQEVMITAVVGALMKCASDMTMKDIAAMDIPEQCATAMLGNHPLGKALRDVLLRPGESGSCFLELFHKVPICTMDLWPFPIDGKSLQQGACISSKLDSVINAECVEGLAVLDTCLPPTKGEITAESCDSYLEECGNSQSMYVTVLMMMPPHLRGMPLPDTCSSAALSKGLGSVVERYEAFRSTCAQTGSKMWADLDSGKGPQLVTFEEFLFPDKEKVVKSSGSAVKSPLESMSGDSEDSSSSSGSGGHFGFGMLTGVGLVGVAYLAFVVDRKRRSTGGTVMSSLAGLELADVGGKYADVPDAEFA